MRKRAAHIVVPAAPRLHKLLELGDDRIPAPPARVVHTVPVVHFPAPVQAQHHIAAFAVGKVDHVVVDQHAVCRERKAEILARGLLYAPRIVDQVLDHLEIHQRFAAEKVDLQIPPVTGAGDQKIQRLPAHLKGHQSALAAVFPLACKAICAVEVAGVRNVEAERFHNARARFLEAARQIGKAVRRKELALRLKRLDLREARVDLLRGYVRRAAVFFQNGGLDLFRGTGFVHADNIIDGVVHNVHGARIHIEHNIQPAEPVTMNHSCFLPYIAKNAALPAAFL